MKTTLFVLSLTTLVSLSASADQRPTAKNQEEQAIEKYVETLDNYLPAGSVLHGTYTLNGETDPDSATCTVRVTTDRNVGEQGTGAVRYQIRLLADNSEDGEADAVYFRVMERGQKNRGHKQTLGVFSQKTETNLAAQLTENKERTNLQVVRRRTQGKTPSPVQEYVTSVSITNDGPKTKRHKHKSPKTQQVTQTCRFSAN